MTPLQGVLAINKPLGITSAQVIRDLQNHITPSKTFAATLAAQQPVYDKRNAPRKRSRKQKLSEKQIKAGHGGTLDPAASGVLVIGLGNGTKRLGDFIRCTKSYETVVLFGAKTDTYDSECGEINMAPYEHVTREAVDKALESFKGEFMQRPPVFSALRIGGKRSYDLAREGNATHEMVQRPVVVVKLEVLDWMPGGTHEFQWPTPKPKSQDEGGAKRRKNNDKSREPPLVQEQTETETLANAATTAATVQAEQVETEAPSSALTTKTDSRDIKTEEEEPLMTSAISEAAAPDDQKPKDAANDSQTKCPAPAVRLRMTVNSGFYVRSLCYDLGEAVGSAAFMAALVRTRQQDFELGKNVFDYSDLEKGEDVWGPSMTKLLHQWNAKSDNAHPTSDT